MQSIRVGNLPYTMTDDDLKRLFSRFGAIANVQIFSNQIIDRFAVIIFYDRDSAERAKVMDGLKIGECYITVS